MTDRNLIKELRTLIKTLKQEVNQQRNLVKIEKEQHTTDIRAVRLSIQSVLDDYHQQTFELQKTLIAKEREICKLKQKKWYQFIQQS
jgi:hypothetical protein